MARATVSGRVYVRFVAQQEERPRDAELIDSLVEVERQIAAAEARRAALMVQFVTLRRSERVPAMASRRVRRLRSTPDRRV